MAFTVTPRSGPVGGRGAGEVDDRGLGGFIMAPANPAVGDETADRGDIDDPPLPAREHRAADHLRANEAMREIEIDVALPGCEVGVLDRDIDIAAADIVDENIDGRRFGEHAPAQILACRGLSDVGGEGPGLALAFAHFIGGPGEGVGVARDKNHVWRRPPRRQARSPGRSHGCPL